MAASPPEWRARGKSCRPSTRSGGTGGCASRSRRTASSCSPISAPIPRRTPSATPSGRIEIFSETVAGFGYDDCPGHPAWIEPREWLGAPLAARFPLHLVSNQPATRLHSQLDPSPVSASGKVAGREAATIHPDDAGPRGIADGDLVRIHNDRGQCLAGAQGQRGGAPGRRRAADRRLVRPGRARDDRHARPPRQPQPADPRSRHLPALPGHRRPFRAGRDRALGRPRPAGRGARPAAGGGGEGRAAPTAGPGVVPRTASRWAADTASFPLVRTPQAPD